MKNNKKTLSKEGKAIVKFWSNFTDSEFLLALMFVTTGNQIITIKDIKLAEFNMEANKDFRKAIHEEALKLDKLETKPKK